MNIQLILVLLSSLQNPQPLQLRFEMQGNGARALNALIEASPSRVVTQYGNHSDSLIQKKFSDLLGANLEAYGDQKHPFVCSYSSQNSQSPLFCELQIQPPVPHLGASMAPRVAVKSKGRGPVTYEFDETFESVILFGFLKSMAKDQKNRQLNSDFVLTQAREMTESKGQCDNGVSFVTQHTLSVRPSGYNDRVIECVRKETVSICGQARTNRTELPRCKIFD